MTPGEYHRVMQRKLIIKEFGPNIQHISGFDNIVADTLSILTSTSVNKYKPSTVKDKCCVKNLFAHGSDKKTNIISY